MATPKLRIVKQPTRFSSADGQRATDWFEEFETIFDASGFSDEEKAKYFPLYLSDIVISWFRTLPAASKEKLSVIKPLFLAAFSPPDFVETSLKALWNRILIPGEKVVSYVYAKLDLCRDVDSAMTEPDRVEWLKRGLPTSYREKLRSKEYKLVSELISDIVEME